MHTYLSTNILQTTNNKQQTTRRQSSTSINDITTNGNYCLEGGIIATNHVLE